MIIQNVDVQIDQPLLNFQLDRITSDFFLKRKKMQTQLINSFIYYLFIG